MRKPTPQALKKELLEVLEHTLSSLEHAHAMTREAATHEEAKPENDKDTRALEQSYLARGQAQRIETLRAGVAAVNAMTFTAGEVCRLGALIEVEEDAAPLLFFLAPEGGGTKLQQGIQVVTPASPLGRALIGKRAGDEVELKLAGKTRVLVVVHLTE